MALQIVKSSESRLGILLEDHLASKKAEGLAPRTLRNRDYQLRTYFLPWCQERGIEDITQLTQRDLDRFSVDLQERGGKRGPMSKATIWTVIKEVRALLKWAKENGEEIKGSLKSPKLGQALIDILSRDEIDLIEDAATNDRDRLIVRILADTGVRVGELISLKANCTRKIGTHYFVRVKGKTGEREVPITVSLARRIDKFVHWRGLQLKQQFRQDSPLFVGLIRSDGEYQPLTENGVQQMIRDLAEKAGIRKRVHPHLFRHSAATYLLQQGMDSLYVARVLGHNSLAMINRVYAHLNNLDVARAYLQVMK